METISLRALRRASIDPIERDLAEVDAAIALVAGGLASRVQLVGLTRPRRVAGTGLARAQDAGVDFRLERPTDGATVVTVGPCYQERR